MEFLKKRQNAFAVLAAVVVVFTLLGVHLSLNRQVAKLDKMFTDGIYVEKDSYTQPGIETHLEARIDSSLPLVTVAAAYPDIAAEAEALKQARHALLDADSITEKYAANSALEEAWQALVPALEGQSLSEADAKTVSTCASNLSGAQKAIGMSLYNENVAEYESGILGTFPVSVLRLAAFPDSPEYFGTEG